MASQRGKPSGLRSRFQERLDRHTESARSSPDLDHRQRSHYDSDNSNVDERQVIDDRRSRVDRNISHMQRNASSSTVVTGFDQYGDSSRLNDRKKDKSSRLRLQKQFSFDQECYSDSTLQPSTSQERYEPPRRKPDKALKTYSSVHPDSSLCLGGRKKVHEDRRTDTSYQERECSARREYSRSQERLADQEFQRHDYSSIRKERVHNFSSADGTGNLQPKTKTHRRNWSDVTALSDEFSDSVISRSFEFKIALERKRSAKRQKEAANAPPCWRHEDEMHDSSCALNRPDRQHSNFGHRRVASDVSQKSVASAVSTQRSLSPEVLMRTSQNSLISQSSSNGGTRRIMRVRGAEKREFMSAMKSSDSERSAAEQHELKVMGEDRTNTMSSPDIRISVTPDTGLAVRRYPPLDGRRPRASSGLYHDIRRIALARGVPESDLTVDEQEVDNMSVGSSEHHRQEFLRNREILYCRTKRKHFRKWDNAQLSAHLGAERFQGWDLRHYKWVKRIKEWKDDLGSWLVMWSKPLKKIEGHFGTGVVSYFLFLRWLLLLNIIIATLMTSALVLPYSLLGPQVNNSSHFNATPNQRTHYGRLLISDTIAVVRNRSELAPKCTLTYQAEVHSKQGAGVFATILGRIQEFLQGTGWMELTAMFIGWYQDRDLALNEFISVKFDTIRYSVPIAFLVVTIVCFIVCFVMMIRYATVSIRETLLTVESISNEGKVHQLYGMVFTAWDYCVTDQKTADLKRTSIAVELKSYLNEAVRIQERASWTRATLIWMWVCRIAVNLVDLTVIIVSLFVVSNATTLSNDKEQESNTGFEALFYQYLPSLTITGLNLVVPYIFAFLIPFERLSMDNQVNATLLRMVALRIMSLGALLVTLQRRIDCTDEGFDPDACKLAGCNRTMCWETSVGQHMYKLTLTDFFVGAFIVLVVETIRRLVVKHAPAVFCNKIGRQEFNIPSRVLDLVYSQGLCWLGMFYCPILPVITCIKYFLVFYLQKYTVLRNCVPSPLPYRASRTNTFFVVVLLMSLFLAVIPFGYVVSRFPPSVACGPYQLKESMWSVITTAVTEFPHFLQFICVVLTGAPFTIFLMILLCVAIYYYTTHAAAHRHMEEVLKQKIVMGARDRQFLIKTFYQEDEATTGRMTSGRSA